MQTDLIQERICDAVRQSVPPGRAIIFESGVVARNEVPAFHLVVARIAGVHLDPYDRELLLSLIDGTIRSDPSGDLVFIDGEIAGSRYELRLSAEPVGPSNA